MLPPLPRVDVGVIPHRRMFTKFILGCIAIGLVLIVAALAF